MAIQVAPRTRSPSSAQPSTAAKNGAEANRNMALATVVPRIDMMLPAKAATRAMPPSTPVVPASRNTRVGQPPARMARTANRKIVRESER